MGGTKKTNKKKTKQKENKVDPELKFLMLFGGLGLGDAAQNVIESSKVLPKWRDKFDVSYGTWICVQ